MLKIVTLLCTAILLTGCGPKLTAFTFQTPSPNENVIVGYGNGSLTSATNNAWKDARRKLDMSGLGKKYGLSEIRSEYQHGTVVTIFKLVPLDEEQTQTANKKIPENLPTEAL